MGIANAVKQFTNDPDVLAVFVLILADFILGVSASVVHRTFRLGWLSDFLRKDVLMKVVPFFVVWWAVHVGGDIHIGNFPMIEEGVNAVVIASLAASCLKSLADLGFTNLPKWLAGSDDPPPQP